MRCAMLVGDNQVKWLANGLILGIPEHRDGAGTPESNDTALIGEDYGFSFHVVTFKRF